MDKKRALIIGIALVIMGLTATLFLIRRPVTISLDGQSREIETAALTTGAALQEAGISYEVVETGAPSAADIRRMWEGLVSQG